MSETRTACPLDCPDACGLTIESSTDGEFVRLRGNPEHSYSRGGLCAKTSLFGEVQTSTERLTVPLIRDASGALVESSWDQALSLIASKVQGVAGDEILSFEYGGNMGKVAKKFPGRIMNALNAIRNDGGICDLTGSVGYESVLGSIFGGDLEAVEDSDFLLLWGVDIARTVQHLQPAVQRMCKRGTPVIAIDIYRTDTIKRLEKWGGRGLIVEQGSDAALALGLARAAYERGFADREFLERECVGAERFEEHARGAHDLAWVAETCGLTLAEVEAHQGWSRLDTTSQRRARDAGGVFPRCGFGLR